MRARLVAVLLVCACGDNETRQCTPEYEKSVVLKVARDWYLYDDLLPSDINPDWYLDAASLLDALTARARAAGQDRYWDFIETFAELDAEAAGANVGFGLRLLERDQRVYLSDVYGGSAADGGGFRRGDEITAVGPAPGQTTPVAELIASDTLSDAFGPAEAGVTRTFEVVTVAGDSIERTISKGEYTKDAVPTYTVIPREGLSPAGYLNLRTFTTDAASGELKDAFTAFGAAGVSDVVIDLRYNGGGYLSLAEQLADEMGAAIVGRNMFTVLHNPLRSGYDRIAAFTQVDGAIAATRVAFIMTGASASASELVPNSLDPYVSVALIGERSYGKPVGQSAFEVAACQEFLYLIAYRLENANGNGGYYDGLPNDGFSGPLCDAEDDLTHEQGDPAEASTAAALEWLATGQCPVAGKTRALRVKDRYPMPSRPTPAQRWEPGLY